MDNEQPPAPTAPPESSATVSVTNPEAFAGHQTSTVPTIQEEAAPTPQTPQTPQSPQGDTGVEFRLDLENDQVIVDFKKILAWVGLRPEQAKLFARILWQKAEELEKAIPRAKVIRLPLRKPEEAPK
jgi:hypothetical protein